MRIIQSDNPRPLNLLAVGPNGLVAAASSAFGVPGGVEAWNVASGESVFAYPGDREQLSVAFHPDGRHLLCSAPDDGVTVADIATGRGLIGLESYLQQPEFALSSDGMRVLITSSNGQSGAVEC